MRILVVYDNTLLLDRVSLSSLNKGDEIYLFSLTAMASMVDQFRGLGRDQGVDVQVLETARFVNDSAEQLRGPYLDFIANIALDVRHRGKNLKEYFAIDEAATLWWMSLVAEKNTFKSDAYNRLAQFDAIVGAIGRHKIQSVFIALDCPKLVNALEGFLRKEKLEYAFWPIRKNRWQRQNLKEYQKMHFWKHFLHLLIFAVSFFKKTKKIQKAMQPYRRNFDDAQQSMFISAFPYFDGSLAKEGIYRNRIFGPLQEAMEAQKRKILWAVFYVNNETVSFDEALQSAQKFIEKGYNIYFLEESCTLKKQLVALFQLLIQSLKFLSMESVIAKRHQWKGYDFYPILKDEWYRSFVGPEAYQPLLHYAMFQDLLARVDVKKAMYHCEMQSWEKALLAAKKKVKSFIPLLAYQHTTVSWMLLNYFHTPMEIHSNGPYSFIQPDKIICNGPLPYEYLSQCGWKKERLAIGEAIRFYDLKKPQAVLSKKDVVLVAFSIAEEESAGILCAVDEAFKDQNVEVWIKPHPFMQMDKVFAMAGMKKEQLRFKIKEAPIEELLREARVAVVGESSVSLQALTLGCEVVIVDIPEWMNMSPLARVEHPHVTTVYSAKELRDHVFKILAQPVPVSVETGHVTDRFFYFNENSDKPERLLDLLK